jgi:oxalate decarboxylase
MADWHRTQAEWGFIYSGSVLVSAVDEEGKYQVDKLGFGDIWYFPKGQAHTIQGLDDENEYLLAFDDGNFDSVGCVFILPYVSKDDSRTAPLILFQSNI